MECLLFHLNSFFFKRQRRIVERTPENVNLNEKKKRAHNVLRIVSNQKKFKFTKKAPDYYFKIHYLFAVRPWEVI